MRLSPMDATGDWTDLLVKAAPILAVAFGVFVGFFLGVEIRRGRDDDRA